jgi:hypothetical protein
MLGSMKLPPYVLAVLAFGALGCNEDADTKPPDDKPVAGSGNTFIIDRDLASVCDGTAGPKGVAKYEKKKGTLSPVSLFFRDEGAKKFEVKSSSVFSPWRAKQGKDTQLAACISVKSKKKVRECKFDKDKPTKWVDQYDTSYTISVRETATGKELAKQDVELKAPGSCPTLFFFKKNREQDLARFEPALLAMMSDLQPTDVPAPRLTNEDLVGACAGKPVPGAAPYEKKAGSISPLKVYRREGADGGWVSGKYQGQTFAKHDWWSSDAEKYQLVACMTTTRGKKAKECEFDGGSKIDLVDAKYEIALYEAATGKKLEKKTFDAKSKTRCPILWNFKEGEEKVSLADPGDEAQKWLASFAAP